MSRCWYAVDGTEFVLAPIEDFDAEIAQTRQNAELMALLDERAKQTKTLPMDEVKLRLGLG